MNEEIKYTPGPWRANDINPSDVGSKNRFICHCINYSGGNVCFTEEDIANAHLIAAAPDMLEALERLVNGRDVNDYKAYETARSAIAKAKGEA